MAKGYKDIEKEVFSEEFRDFCEKNVIKYLFKLEKSRKFYLFIIGLIYLICIVYVISLISHFDGSNCNEIIAIWAAVFFTVLIHHILGGGYATCAKEVILPKLLSYVGNIQVIENNNPMRYELQTYVAGLDAIPQFNDFTCNYFLTCSYNYVGFSVSELYLMYEYKYYEPARQKLFNKKQVPLQHEDRNNERTSKDVIFEGFLISFKSFKEFSQNVLILPNGKPCSHLKAKKPNYKRVNFEDPEFEKSFDVYGVDETEARYLITPAFMDRMVQLSKKPFANGLFASFENGMVNVFVPTVKNLFEMSIVKPVTDIESYRRIVLELLSLFSVADTLKIDENAGK